MPEHGKFLTDTDLVNAVAVSGIALFGDASVFIDQNFDLVVETETPVIEFNGCAEDGQDVAGACDDAALDNILVAPGYAAAGIDLVCEKATVAVIDRAQRHQRGQAGLTRERLEALLLAVSHAIDFEYGFGIGGCGNLAEVAMTDTKRAQLYIEAFAIQVDARQ